MSPTEQPAAPMEDNHIYQYSLLNALMDGVSETGISVAKLASRGNQGLGTFARMNGELLFLDGVVYQLQAEGNVREADESDQIPFAVSTKFVSQQTRKVPFKDKNAIDEVLDSFNSHAKNLFMTYRINGHFNYLKCRTVRGQEYRGQPLSELGKKQSLEEYHDVEGTIIGFRTPKNWQGFGVAGEHLHFIKKDRKAGGHVLEVTAEEVEMQMAVASNVHVELPTSEDFNAAKLVTDDAGVKEVEG
jgi:alpha-acetolactate decarboxylase